MSNAFSNLILSAVLFAGIMALLIAGGLALVKRGAVRKEAMARAVISIAVFAAIYWGSGFVIGWREFNLYVNALEFLAAVIGAGCYWIGSNQR